MANENGRIWYEYTVMVYESQRLMHSTLMDRQSTQLTNFNSSCVRSLL